MIESDNFTPFFGKVESVDDPIKAGRYRVRVFGYNSESTGILPTENIKWFSSGVSNSAGMSGIGHSPTGYVVGSFVFGFYIDKDRQDGIIICAFNGTPNGSTDVSDIATGVGGEYVEALRKSLTKSVPDARGEMWSEPETKYAAEYSKNNVFQSQSGHVMEYDDTPGAERITVFHKAGTFTEIHPDGKRVQKTVKDSFDIHLGGHHIYIKGDLNAVVTGDYRLSVGGEYYVKAKNVVFDTPTLDVYGISSANDHISANVSGAYHIHSGVFPGPGYSGSPEGATTMFTPTPANKFYLETEDSGYTPRVIQQGLSSGFLTPEDVITIENSEPIIEEVDETPPGRTWPETVACGLSILKEGKVDYNVQLSPNVKLRDVSIGAVVSNYTIRDQAGLKIDAIICNLKNIAVNVIEPLKAKYPNVMITSAFRHGSGGSQHLKGEAIDIQFSGMPSSQYFEVAKWIKTNLPHDQLLYEMKNTGTKLPWIHISLTRGRNRGQTLTFFNHRKVADGLVQSSWK